MNNFEQIDIHAVHKMLDGVDVTLVDIRDQASFRQAHIKGAVSLSDQNVKAFVQEANKEKPLICYCYHGMSSQSAASYFKSQGFKNVYSMIGGYEEWRKNY